jgi:hypothetical protein
MYGLEDYQLTYVKVNNNTYSKDGLSTPEGLGFSISIGTSSVGRSYFFLLGWNLRRILKQKQCNLKVMKTTGVLKMLIPYTQSCSGI